MSVPEKDPQQLIKQIGRALLGAAPPGWKQIRAEYRSAGRHVEADVVITAADEQQHPIRPPMDVVELLGELRALMYRPGRGTWMSGRYVLDHPSKYNAEFEPDIEPRWRRVPPPIGFQDELRRFPREDAHIPEWLRVRAGLPPLAEPAPAPPADTPRPEETPDPAAPSGTPRQERGSGPRPHPGHATPSDLQAPTGGAPTPAPAPGPSHPQPGGPPATPPPGFPIAPSDGPPTNPPSRYPQSFEGPQAGFLPEGNSSPHGRFPPSFESQPAGGTPPPDTPPSGLPQSRPAGYNQPGGVPFPQQGAALTHTPPAGMPIPAWGAPPDEGTTPPERP